MTERVRHHRPEPADFEGIARELETCALWMRAAAPTVRAQLAPSDNKPSMGPGGGDGQSGPKDATGGAAAATVDNWLINAQLDIRDLAGWLHDDLYAFISLVSKTQSKLKKNGGTTPVKKSDIDHCVERHCEDEASPRHAGRCRPCYDWRYRYSTAHGGNPAPPVPAEVIAARIALREGRKVHVDPTSNEVLPDTVITSAELAALGSGGALAGIGSVDDLSPMGDSTP